MGQKKDMRLFAHPSNVCMSYGTHFLFSMYLAKEFFIAAICAIIHAIYPDWFVTHSSDTVRKLMHDMQDAGCRK